MILLSNILTTKQNYRKQQIIAWFAYEVSAAKLRGNILSSVCAALMFIQFYASGTNDFNLATVAFNDGVYYAENCAPHLQKVVY